LYYLAIATAPSLSAATCESLASLQLPNTTVTAAESHVAGPFAPPAGKPLRVSVDFCRVALTLRPSSDSDIRTEVWMPAANWNGKFQGIGNGGFAGAISYEGGLAAAVSVGYAAASTDTGHRPGGTDAAWALDHPEKIVDFGYRAIHETALAARTVIRAFYGDGPKHSYFNYCSNGGRQALMEVQRYPADYDGIVAGAPANAWTHLLTAAIVDSQATADPAGYIPASKLPAIEAAALAACDANDGVKDGVIENPVSCRFDPGALLCKGEESAACLTAPQIAVLRKLYAGPGPSIVPGFSPGGEADPGGWAAWITGSRPGNITQLAFGDNFFKYMVYDDPSWDYKTSPLERNLQASEAKTGSRLNATEADLSQFRARGGKLILFHGWSDAAIPPQATIDYYQSVVKKMGAKDAAGFVRLFMAPGVGHCSGGAGPNVFGQLGAPAADADHDIDAAVERWVERGIAPERVIATKFKSGANPAGGIERTRPLCSYPQEIHITRGVIVKSPSFSTAAASCG
jgi:Tannase and feruloyl esterase